MTRATMRAVVQEGYGSADVLHLREVAMPAIAANGVLVRVRAASVNAMDYHLVRAQLLRIFMGVRAPRNPIRGVDVAGVVEAVGPAVSRFKPGDEVFGFAKGAFAEYAPTTEDRLLPKPQRLSFEQAAAVPLAAITALQALRDKAHVRPGQRVLIHGAGGGVGTFAVQIAKALGAHVTAVTGPRNMDVVRALGPDQLIDYSREDVTLSAQRWDVFFDNAATRPLRNCVRVIEPQGTFVGVGAPKGGWMNILTGMLGTLALRPFVRQRVPMFLARSNATDLATLVDLIEAGKISPVIDREYALDEVPEAIRYTSAGLGRAKVVIRV